MKELIKRYEDAKKIADELYFEILETPDGFLYVTKLRCYGSIRWENHKNEYSVKNLCDEYYGDNGIVEVYTNNPNHSIESYGGVNVLSEKEIIKMSKMDISMSEALCNWLVRTI